MQCGEAEIVGCTSERKNLIRMFRIMEFLPFVQKGLENFVARNPGLTFIFDNGEFGDCEEVVICFRTTSKEKICTKEIKEIQKFMRSLRSGLSSLYVHNDIATDQIQSLVQSYKGCNAETAKDTLLRESRVLAMRMPLSEHPRHEFSIVFEIR